MSLTLLDPLRGEGTWTDPFGWRAGIPGVVGPQLHTGADKAAPEGTPVVAMHSGRISRTYVDRFVNGERAGGRMIALGAARCESRYAHLSRYAVRAGDEVKAGQVIGYVGHDGAATADHLHVELLLGGQFVDPRPYIRKDTPVTKDEIQRIARATAAEILDTPVARHADPKKRTTLRELIAFQPLRAKRERDQLAAIVQTLRQLAGSAPK